MTKECALNLMREHLTNLHSNPNIYEDGTRTVIYAMEAVIIPMLEKAVEQDRANMTLSEVLLHKTKVGDLVLIEDCGWLIGLLKTKGSLERGIRALIAGLDGIIFIRSLAFLTRVLIVEHQST